MTTENQNNLENSITSFTVNEYNTPRADEANRVTYVMINKQCVKKIITPFKHLRPEFGGGKAAGEPEVSDPEDEFGQIGVKLMAIVRKFKRRLRRCHPLEDDFVLSEHAISPTLLFSTLKHQVKDHDLFARAPLADNFKPGKFLPRLRADSDLGDFRGWRPSLKPFNHL